MAERSGRTEAASLDMIDVSAARTDSTDTPAAEDRYMGEALNLAHAAAAEGDVPVGCVIVRDGVIVGRGQNRREARQSTLAHAEIEAIAEANRTLGTWRLDDCELYVTLEPCPMCAGAILNGRIRRVWYGARDEAMGACGGVMNLFMEDYPHAPAVVGNLRGRECREVLSRFFERVRERRTGESAAAENREPERAGSPLSGTET